MQGVPVPVCQVQRQSQRASFIPSFSTTTEQELCARDRSGHCRLINTKQSPYLQLYPGSTEETREWNKHTNMGRTLPAEQSSQWEGWAKVQTTRWECSLLSVQTRSMSIPRDEPGHPLMSLILGVLGYKVMCYAKSLQSCPTLWDPMVCSPPGSSVHGILQAGILEWVAIFFSRGFSWPRKIPHLLSLLHWQAGSFPLVPCWTGRFLRSLPTQKHFCVSIRWAHGIRGCLQEGINTKLGPEGKVEEAKKRVRESIWGGIMRKGRMSRWVQESPLETGATSAISAA